MCKEFWSKVAACVRPIKPNVTIVNQFDIHFGPFCFQNELLSFIVLAAKRHIHGSYWSRRSQYIYMFLKLLLALLALKKGQFNQT